MIVYVECFHLLYVCLLLRVVDREGLHEVVGWVGELGNGHRDLLEVPSRSLCVTLVNDVSVSHENETIKVIEGLGRGRVDRAHNCLTLFTGEIVKQFADAQSLERIKTGSWLVEKDD